MNLREANKFSKEYGVERVPYVAGLAETNYKKKAKGRSKAELKAANKNLARAQANLKKGESSDFDLAAVEDEVAASATAPLVPDGAVQLGPWIYEKVGKFRYSYTTGWGALPRAFHSRSKANEYAISMKMPRPERVKDVFRVDENGKAYPKEQEKQKVKEGRLVAQN